MAVDAERQTEIDILRASAATTRRATVPAVEALLYEPLPVLDHGFIRVIDYMGDDAAIVQAARVSYGRGTKQVSGDRGLINYLMRHCHTSPFEMCELKLHVKLPIFVARQWIRHRTANVNEYSARYSVLDREFYIPDKDLLKLLKTSRKEEPVQERLFALPTAEHTAAQSSTNKQGREEVLAADSAAGVLREIGAISSRSFTVYEKLLGDDERPGIARELARMVLPLNTYTQWYWKVDLHNLLHFLSLRMDLHAQQEIQDYAKAMFALVQPIVPHAAEAFLDYEFEGVHLTRLEIESLKSGKPLATENKRESAEWEEKRKKMGL